MPVDVEEAIRAANQAVLLDFLLEDVLPMLRPDGVWMPTSVAPLPATEVEKVLKLVARHENYRRQHLATRTEDGFVVDLQNGIVSKERT